MPERIIPVFGEIGPEAEFFGGTSFRSFKEQFDAADSDDITIEIFSPGGSVIEGLAIFDIIKASPKNITTRIIGLAGSIASVIALAGATREITKNAQFFIHNPRLAFSPGGEADDLRDQADELDRLENRLADIYAGVSNLDTTKIKSLMDDETTFNAEEAQEAGFVTEIVEELEAVALTNKLNKYNMENKGSLMDQIKGLIKPKADAEPTTLEVVDSSGNTHQIETEAITDGLEVELEAGEYQFEGSTFEVADGKVANIKTAEEIKAASENAEAEMTEVLETVETLVEQNKAQALEIENLKKMTSSPKAIVPQAQGTQLHQSQESPEKVTKAFAIGGRFHKRLQEIAATHKETLKAYRSFKLVN